MKKIDIMNYFLRLSACFVTGFVILSCADNDVEEVSSNNERLVQFNVTTMQDKVQTLTKTRASSVNQLTLQGLTSEDLTIQSLPAQNKSDEDYHLIETTLAGVPSTFDAPTSTRANITTMATMKNFSTIAFNGTSAADLSPWFYNKDTKKDGTLVTPTFWNDKKTHACFYAVYPKPYEKLVLSPEGNTATPYVNFEVEADVKNQKDLMTACSGNVNATNETTGLKAPKTDLIFRHALTAVRFKVGENLSADKHITKIEIVNAKSKGKYTLPTDKNNTGSWGAASLSTPKTFTLGGDQSINISTKEAVNNIIVGKPGDNYVFYMIPQSLNGVKVNIYFDNATTPSLTYPLAGTWKAGTTKTYSLTEKNSTWMYELTVTSYPAVGKSPNTSNYTIESYRNVPGTNTLEAVPWKIVGYSVDNGKTWTNEKPDWLRSLSLKKGDGSTDPRGEKGYAEVAPQTYVDILTPMNKAMKENPKGSATNYYDLSTHDVKGNSTPRNTANSYVISHPGYYKIPLVYGNAIKNGNTNTSAYQTRNSGQYILTNFKDYNNKDITDPWITRSNGGTNVPNGAKLVWSDEQDIVSNLSVKGDYVQFEIPADKIKSGNAVIAVTKDGVVVWSWHLWFTHEDALNTITCTNAENKDYAFTKETLGMKYTSWQHSNLSAPRTVKVKIKQENGHGDPASYKESYLNITQYPAEIRRGNVTHYQFGRKDAFPGTYDRIFGQMNYKAGNNMSISNSIQHPENIYNEGSSWDKNYTYYNLWSANNTIVGYNDNEVVKTVYDPCPPGFKLPASNAYSGFVINKEEEFGELSGKTNNASSTDYGQSFYNRLTNPDATIYFPLTGYRIDGIWDDMSTFSYYLTATPNVHYGGAFFMFYLTDSKARLQTSYGLKATTGGIRPVAE